MNEEMVQARLNEIIEEYKQSKEPYFTTFLYCAAYADGLEAAAKIGEGVAKGRRRDERQTTNK